MKYCTIITLRTTCVAITVQRDGARRHGTRLHGLRVISRRPEKLIREYFGPFNSYIVVFFVFFPLPRPILSFLLRERFETRVRVNNFCVFVFF